MTALEHVQKLMKIHGQLTYRQINKGFMFGRRRIPLFNRQRGIFKPRQMQFLISIKTVVPRQGREVWYSDQENVHQQIYKGMDSIDYAFMGSDPEKAENRWLLNAHQHQVPLIYFLGVAPAIYHAIVPTYVCGWDPVALKARITFGTPEQVEDKTYPENPERRFALRIVKQRLHQSSFRELVISAYGGSCALSGLRERRLLDAAHIVADKEEELGQPVVPNGLLLSKLHHAAFDANFIGIDPDFSVHVSRRLLGQRDGPMLDALKRLEGRKLKLPRKVANRPDRNRLAARFEQFQATN